MDTFDTRTTLERLYDILQSHHSSEAAWLAEVLTYCDSDEDRLFEKLNSKHMWGGAGSVANEALADNCCIEEWQWRVEIREFRELMIALGEYLMTRGHAYPDISSWLLAFNNWNQSEV
jgi:hypothetical protein